jgi:KGK domain
MHDRFEPLDSGEVVSVRNDIQILNGHRTFRVGELSDAIKAQLASEIAGWTEDKNNLLDLEGVDCEALRFGANGWQKGRMRLCLEFCPDEPHAAAEQATGTSVAETSFTTTSPSAPAVAPVHHSEPVAQSAPEHSNTEYRSDFATVDRSPEVLTHAIGTAIPAVGIAAAGVAAATAIATEPPAVTAPETAAEPLPPMAEAILEPEEVHSSTEIAGEIAFDFDREQSDKETTVGTNSVMELDLTDLGLDLGDPDLLNFDGNGSLDGHHEFVNLQDLDDRPENSGMLIDEVWNEMSQPNWPGIN